MKYTKKQEKFVEDLIKKGKNITVACRAMCSEFEIPYSDAVRRTFSNKLEKKGLTDNVRVIEDAPEFKTAQTKQYDNSKQTVMVGWCQNETPVNEGLITNMEALAKDYDATIHIIAGRYKNPTSVEANNKIKDKEKSKYNWHKRVIPYLDANRHKVHNLLSILSDIKTQPTASTPLTGFNGVSGLESCIIGHPRVQMKSLPVLEGYPHKLLVTTGAVSMENYTDTKAGKKGEFHHQFGFVIAELDGDLVHIRQVVADRDGNFYDLFKQVKDGVVYDNDKCEAIVFGDLHIGDEDEKAVKASFEIAERLNPKKIVLHDVFNGTSVNHHEQKDPFVILEREQAGQLSLRKEIKQLKNWFKKHSEFEYIVSRSNHDDFLDRWLQNSDWRKVPNKADYLKYANIIAKGKAPNGIIPYVLEKFDNITCLGIDDGYRILGWEVSQHGHIGFNGSRGSAMQFKVANTKMITAHGHAPSREDGHLCVGTLTELRMGFNKGMSGWMHSDVIIFPNGKAQHINFFGGRYTRQ